MASIQEIKHRIKAVQNTGQITRAMELVSATKMRRSQEVALLSRPYAVEALRILGELKAKSEYLPEIMKEREVYPTTAGGLGVKKSALVLVASDRGLAGAFNANVFRAFDKWATSLATKYENSAKLRTTQFADLPAGRQVGMKFADWHHIAFIAVGKKAEDYLTRNGIQPHQSFKGFGDYIEPEETWPLTKLLVDGYLNHEWDEVTVISMHFRTTLKQEVMIHKVLPIKPEMVREMIKEVVPEYGRYSEMGKNNINGNNNNFEYKIEPDPKTALDRLAPELLETILYDLILEANASEHSARMVAMKNASENAEELQDELQIQYNKSRQANITREIAEIVGGAEALST